MNTNDRYSKDKSMAEKCWAEGGDRGVNDSGTELEPTKKKRSRKYKNGSNPICRLCKQKTESIDLIVSDCPILTLIDYKEMHKKIGYYIH